MKSTHHAPAAASHKPGEHPSFVIWSGGFREDSGGIIALHYLCHLLNRRGVRAYLWPAARPYWGKGGSWRDTLHHVRALARYWYGRLRGNRFRTNPAFVTPLARAAHLRGSVVVYPEKIDFNPLHAKAVVRWLLYKPGAVTGRINYGPDDLIFFYQDYFNDPELNPHDDNHLRVIWIRDDLYRQTNSGDRSGTCYLVKKGKNRSDINPPPGAICIDGKSHAEVARIFNSTERFYSYDAYTMYSTYAAMCGCLSVVVPMPGVSKEEWRPHAETRCGVAYGDDDAAWARETRPDLLSGLAKQKRLEEEMVWDFVGKCERHFGPRLTGKRPDSAA